MISNLVNVKLPLMASAAGELPFVGAAAPAAPAVLPAAPAAPGMFAGAGAAAAAAPAPAPVAAAAAAPAAAAENQQVAVPSFITPASLVTVSGGTATVTLLWSVAEKLIGDPAKSIWVPFGISIVIGGVIYALSIGDSNVNVTTRQKAIGAFIGFLNSMVLFAAAVGLLK